MIDTHVVRAVFRKDIRSYLSNPTGYVFLTLFIAVTAAAAFLQDGFFARNLADLALLNTAMPAILMFFVPALTMSAWADERRSGTDELVLTLPVRDAEVIVGKYLGAYGMFSVALGFSLAHLAVLAILGDPDIGLMVSTYFGYWLMGMLLTALGLFGSMLAGNSTGGFVLGVLGCAGLVFAAASQGAGGFVGTALFAGTSALIWLTVRGGVAGTGWAALGGGLLALVLWLSGLWSGFPDLFVSLSLETHFHSFGEGVIRLGDVAYFLAGTIIVLYLCGLVLGRRRW